jgi:hypothetical protein
MDLFMTELFADDSTTKKEDQDFMIRLQRIIFSGILSCAFLGIVDSLARLVASWGHLLMFSLTVLSIAGTWVAFYIIIKLSLPGQPLRIEWESVEDRAVAFRNELDKLAKETKEKL